jgi:hypothetical protein
MNRLETILVGAYGDLLAWKAKPGVPLSGLGSGRHRMLIHNSRVRDAANDVIDCDAARWLGRPPLAGDAVCNTRTYRELEQRGLAVRLHAGAYNGRGRTVALHLTEAGKLRAAELLSQLPASAGNFTPAEPALADSQNLVECKA